MAEKALTIAKYIVSKCSREGRPATGLALQKMLYDAQKDPAEQFFAGLQPGTR